MNRLSGKMAIAAGGAMGMGHARVERMAEEGTRVGIFELLQETGRALADALVAGGHEAVFWSWASAMKGRCGPPSTRRTSDLAAACEGE